jgi:hypothetical protein
MIVFLALFVEDAAVASEMLLEGLPLRKKYLG